MFLKRDIDLNAYGIRIVECSQAGGPGIFIKVADALNIGWHLVADNDQGGQVYIENAKELLNGRNEQEYISILSYENTDILLCCSGYGAPYKAGVGWKRVNELTEPEGSEAYWKQVYKVINKSRFSKPAAALDALMLMRRQGENGVPAEIKSILQKISGQQEEISQ